jgi:transposase
MTTELPDDIEQLKQMLAKLQHDNNALNSEMKTLNSKNKDLENRLDIALEQLKLNRKKQFGQHSEKMPKGTFNEAEKHQSIEKNKNKNKKKDEPKGKTGRKPLPKDLEREERDYTLDNPTCDCCGHGMHECGVQISEQIKIIPEKISVIKHKQTKYACRECETTSTSTSIITAPKPAQPIPQSIASAEALAAVVTAKYCDALPLYRLTDIFSRGGLDISRSTLANWCIASAELVSPLIAVMKANLLSQSTLCADETTVQVLDEPGRKAASKSYMWVYRSNEFSDNPVVIYDYQPSRARSCPATFLAGYKGYLQCDGYSVYENMEGIMPVGCWAHARRKFYDALTVQPKKTGKATMGLNYIQKLYAIEKKAKTLPPDKRKLLRQEKAEPILAALHEWLEKSTQTVLPKSKIGVAIKYTLNQWEKLRRYLESGELGIDNNITERDIRPFTTGRKNWMFCQSVNGAKASAALYSLVMTCRANDINPYFYFQKLFTELPQRDEFADLSDLLPWNADLEA